MSDHQEAKQATPHATLLAELLDSRIPKSEREHAAAREVERLTAALRHEADCVEAANAEIERLTAENKMLRHTHRWNVSPQVDDSLLVCRHLHEKDEKCDLEHYVPAGRLHDAIRERDELRRQLAEACKSIARQAATIRELTRPAEAS